MHEVRSVSPRGLLTEAQRFYAAGQPVPAGCLLRCAIEIHLRALCERHGVKAQYVRDDERRGPPLWWNLLVLRRLNLLPSWTGAQIKKVVFRLNLLAHGYPVDATSVEKTMRFAQCFLATEGGEV